MGKEGDEDINQKLHRVDHLASCRLFTSLCIFVTFIARQIFSKIRVFKNKITFHYKHNTFLLFVQTTTQVAHLKRVTILVESLLLMLAVTGLILAVIGHIMHLGGVLLVHKNFLSVGASIGYHWSCCTYSEISGLWYEKLSEVKDIKSYQEK